MTAETNLPTKRFGIRGDRLLLFLDIVQSLSWLDRSSARAAMGWGGQFSRAAMLRLLWDKLGMQEGGEDLFARYYTYEVEALRFFLRSNATKIADIEFDGLPILLTMGIEKPDDCDPGSYKWYMVSIFTNVAVGKYTRKDFE